MELSMGSQLLDMSIPVPAMGKLVMERDKREQHEETEAQGCSAKPMIDAAPQNFVSPQRLSNTGRPLTPF